MNLGGEDAEAQDEGQPPFAMMMTARQEITEDMESDEPEQEEVTEEELSTALLEAVEAIKRSREEGRSADAVGIGAHGG